MFIADLNHSCACVRGRSAVALLAAVALAIAMVIVEMAVGVNGAVGGDDFSVNDAWWRCW